MEHNFYSYQSAETEWRYEVHISRAKDEINRLEALLKIEKNKLDELESKPPMTHLFNWSA